MKLPRLSWTSFITKPHTPEYPRWPEHGKIEDWMSGKIAHYRAHYPDQAYQLFDLSCGDYLPASVHVARSFGPNELAIYRKMKEANPDLVLQARQSTGHRLFRSRIYDPDDWPNEDMFP